MLPFDTLSLILKLAAFLKGYTNITNLLRTALVTLVNIRSFPRSTLPTLHYSDVGLDLFMPQYRTYHILGRILVSSRGTTVQQPP